MTNVPQSEWRREEVARRRCTSCSYPSPRRSEASVALATCLHDAETEKYSSYSHVALATCSCVALATCYHDAETDTYSQVILMST